MYRTMPWAVLVLLIIAALCSCSTSRSGPALAPDADAAAAESPLAKGLPGLADLPAPPHGSSALAPGFHQLDQLNTIARANAVDDLGSIKMDNAGGLLTYALYGVYGFDGDNYPVSVKLNVGDGGGNFWIAFSDFASGNWSLSGPFNADGEFGIPLLDEHTDPRAFVSPDSYHYFAVIAEAGALVYIDGVELGVSGGDNAPDPVLQFNGKGGLNGMYLYWMPSESYLDPDFAGYIVERAPQFGGDFVPLAAQPQQDTYFNDSTAVLETLYRYRIATYDTSGNLALSTVQSLGPSAADEAAPVIVAQLPSGPLHSPAEVTIDLGDSFDPEGEGITSYEISYFGPVGTVVVPGPLANLTLEPGCYVILLRVECMDGRSATGFRLLKVYPSWAEFSVAVRAPDASGTWKSPRLFAYRGGKQPSDNRITLAGYDITMAGLVFYHYNGAGGFSITSAPQIEYVVAMGEPVTVENNLVFPVATPYDFLAASYDGTAVVLADIASVTNSYGIALTKDNSGRLWAAYGHDSGIETRVFLDGELFGAGTEDIGLAAGAISQIDVATEPASGHIFVFYSDGASVSYAEYDPVADMALGGGPLFAGSANTIDAEINPENDRLAVIFNVANHIYYREQDGIGGFTAPVEIDNSMDNTLRSDMTPSAAGKLNAYFSLASGQAHRYIYSGGVWSLANTSSFSPDSGYDVCLLPVASSPDVSAIDLCDDGVIRFARMNDDGTDNVYASIDGVLGQGRDMHGTAGIDGLHLIWSRVFSLGGVTHCLSPVGPDEGEFWLEVPSIVATHGLNLVTNSTGSVYATGYDGANANLYYWDHVGGGFIIDQSFAADSLHRPVLGTEFAGTGIRFGVWDDVGGSFHFITGEHGAYDPDNPWVPAINPVWEGIFSNSPFWPGFAGLCGGTQDKPVLTFTPPGSTVSDLFAVSVLEDQYSPFDKPSVIGRNIGAAVAMTGYTMIDQLTSIFVYSQGGATRPTRYSVSLLGQTDSFDYPLNDFSEFMDPRFSVSVSTANGLTAVNLLSSLDGSRSYFEWSNLGDWEQLELPPGLDNMSEPLVVVGLDGRWHLVYRDWKTDYIMCRSTL